MALIFESRRSTNSDLKLQGIYSVHNRCEKNWICKAGQIKNAK